MNSEAVYLVWEHYDNCEDWEDHHYLDRVVAVMKTKDEADEIVKKLYDKILSITEDEFGYRVSAMARYFEDGEIDDVLVENVEGCSRTSGSYSYSVEEFEIGKLKYQDSPS